MFHFYCIETLFAKICLLDLQSSLNIHELSWIFSFLTDNVIIFSKFLCLSNVHALFVQQHTLVIVLSTVCEYCLLRMKTFYPGSFYGRDNIHNMYDLLEEMAAEYRQLPGGEADKDFVELTVQAIRHLKK